LFQPFFYNRQDIQIPSEPNAIRAPAIGDDGKKLLNRISLSKISVGYAVLARSSTI
jgi:hypothetical protein